MMSRMLILALALYGAAAVPLFEERGLDDPGCVASVPATADADTVNKVYLAALGRNVDMRVMQATFETCLQESHCNNLKCGDQDSLGAFQQRPSMGWGTAAQVSDVTYAAGKFLDQAIPLAAANPGFTPDQIAQGVQHAELGNLYAQQLNWANQLISQAAAATGKAAPGGGSGGGGSAPAPPPSSGGSGCDKKYTAVSGDWCSKIASANGISVAQFQQMNPSINGQCTNIQIGTAYCV